MDYYKRKILAIQKIKKLMNAGINTDDIELIILEEYGFNEKFTNQIIDKINKSLLNSINYQTKKGKRK